MGKAVDDGVEKSWANDSFDFSISKSRVDIARSFFKRRVHLARGGIFDGNELKDLPQALQSLLEDSREESGQAARW